MRSNLAYIDETIDRAIDKEARNPALSEATRSTVKEKAYKVIAGFRLQDEEAERKLLDEQIELRKKQIKAFRADRSKAREALEKIGIKPLAIVPTGAWVEICLQAKLFLLNPDKDGRIPIPVAAFKDYSAKQIEFAWKSDKIGLLSQYFPGGRTASTRGAILANLILPAPPPDVAGILVKASALPLQVAAVSDAIDFAEKPTDLLNRSKESNPSPGKPYRGFKSYEEWLAKCPIIYTEQGCATAVIAQFGDFPIEQHVVNAVVASDKLLPEKAEPVKEMGMDDGPEGHYRLMMHEYLRARTAVEPRRSWLTGDWSTT